MKSILAIVAAAALVLVAFVAAEHLFVSSGPIDALAQKASEKGAAPQGVSPADPNTPMPQMDDEWFCWRCGASNPYPKRHYKDPMHRPMLSPGAGRGGGARARAPRGGDMGRGGLACDRVLRRGEALNLTGDQIERLERLSFDTKSKLIDLQAELQKEHLELERMIRAETDDATKLRRQLDAVSKKRVAIQSERLDSWMSTRKILTEEQKKIIEERFRGMGSPLE